MLLLVRITSEDRDEVRIGETVKCQKYSDFPFEAEVVDSDLLACKLMTVSNFSRDEQLYMTV